MSDQGCNPSVSVDDEGIAVLNLGNGQNRFSIESVGKLHKALDEIENNSSSVVLIVTASGKFFSNGLDLVRLSSSDPDAFWLTFNHFLCRLITFPMPTIAAINGHAFAGGCFMSLTTDIRVMNSERGWMSINEVYMPSRIPIFLNQIVKYRVPRGSTMQQLYCLGRRFTAAEALEAGLVQYKATDVLSKAKEIARERLKYGPLGRDSVWNLKVDLNKEILATWKNLYKFEDQPELPASKL